MRSPREILEKMRGLAAAVPTTRAAGQAAEDAALHYLQRQGLRLVARNWRTPGRGGGEIDLIVQEADGTVVFVEVRQRRRADHGGAGGSIGVVKQRRIVLAARHWLAQQPRLPPCRFDAVLLEPEIRWLKAAFDAE
ncbi:YraN family protein [Comamonas humi]